MPNKIIFNNSVWFRANDNDNGELSIHGNGTGYAFIDLKSGPSLGHYTRIIREGGPDGDSAIFDSGAGDLILASAGGTVQNIRIRNNSGIGEVEFPSLATTSSGSIARLEYNSSTGGYVLKRDSSSIRYKDDIKELTSNEANSVYRLRPTTFRSKSTSNNDTRYLGFIAEEVDEVEPKLIEHGANGVPESIVYDRITVLLVKAVQDLQEQINSLRKELNDYRKDQ